MLIDLISALMSGEDNIPLVLMQIVLVLAIVVFSLSVHEMAHAWAAKKLGDYTAYNQGRVSLNPLRHLDPFGFLSMLLIGIGWAKPVQIQPGNFRNPRKGMMLSSLAGPLSNFIVGVISCFFTALVQFLFQISLYNGSLNRFFYILYALNIFFYYAAYLNFSLAIFNLIPCPPFDGSRIFFYFMPKSWYFRVMRYERYIGPAILILILGLSYFGFDPVSFLAGGLYTLVCAPFLKGFNLLLNLIF